MVDPPSPTSPTPRPRRGWLVLGVVVGLLFAAYSAYRLRLEAVVESTFQSLRDAGSPATPAELDLWYSLPEGAENAADLFLEAARHVPELDETRHADLVASLPERLDKPLSDAQRAAIDRYLELGVAAFAPAERAARLEQARYPIAAGLGRFDTELAHLPPLGRLNRLLSLCVVRAADRGDLDLAIERLRIALALPRSLRREPLLVSQLTAMAVEKGHLELLAGILSRAALAPEAVARLRETLDRQLADERVERALIGERVLMVDLLGRADELLEPQGAVYAFLERVARLGKLNVPACVDLVGRLIEVNRLPVERRFDALTRWRELVEREGLVPTIFVLSLGELLEADLERLARFRAARVALDVERLRAAEGHLPERLEDLVPRFLAELPGDPFDGGPLRYRRLEPGYVIYSVGPDRTDGGGVAQSPDDGRPVHADGDPGFAVFR